jgi:hypothetical protein
MGRPGCGVGCGVGCARIGCWLMICTLLGAVGLGALITRKAQHRRIA